MSRPNSYSSSSSSTIWSDFFSLSSLISGDLRSSPGAVIHHSQRVLQTFFLYLLFSLLGGRGLLGECVPSLYWGGRTQRNPGDPRPLVQKEPFLLLLVGVTSSHPDGDPSHLLVPDTSPRCPGGRVQWYPYYHKDLQPWRKPQV